MVAKATQKEVTLAEFKAWLEGVEELQERGWSPDTKQWKLIRNKIKNIIDVAPAQNAVATAPVAPHRFPGTPVPGTPVGEASALGIPPAPDTPVTGFPSDAVVQEPSQAASALLSGDETAKRKTPDLDTTDGNYESAFT